MTSPYVLGIRHLKNEHELITVGKGQVELSSKYAGDSEFRRTAVQLGAAKASEGVGRAAHGQGRLLQRGDIYV